MSHLLRLRHTTQASWLRTKGQDLHLIKCPFRQVLLMGSARKQTILLLRANSSESDFQATSVSHLWVLARPQWPLTRERGSLGSTSSSRTNAYRPAMSTVLKPWSCPAVSSYPVWKDSCHHLQRMQVQSSKSKTSWDDLSGDLSY